MRNFRYLVILFLVSLFLMGCKIVDTQVTTSTTTEATTTADTTTTTEEIPKTIPTGDIQYELTKDQLKIQATLTDPDKIVTYVSITLESDEDLKTLTSEKDRIFNNKSNLSYTFNKLNKNTTYTLSMIVDYQDESQKKEDVVLVSHEITTEIWTSGKILNPENKKGEITFDVQLDDPDSNTDYYILLKLFNTTVDERKLDDLSSTNNYISNLKFDNIFILPNYPYQIVLISSSETINNQIDVYHFYPNLYVTIPSVGLQNTVIVGVVYKYGHIKLDLLK